MNTLADMIRYFKGRNTAAQKRKALQKQDELVYNALKDEFASYGYELDYFASLVRDFFLEAQIHYARLLYRGLIAEHFGIDLSDTEGWKEFCYRVGKATEAHRIEQARWTSGDVDIPMSNVIAVSNCINLERANDHACQHVGRFNSKASIAFAIGRTLTFIRVFPPENKNAWPIAGDIYANELRDCWGDLRDHQHFKRKKPTLNQHAINYVYQWYAETLCIRESQIGALKRQIEDDTLEEQAGDKPLNLGTLVFKYATLAFVNTDNYQGYNPYRWLWDDQLPAYQTIWQDAYE